MEDAAYGLAELYGGASLLEGWAILDHLNHTPVSGGTFIFVPNDESEFLRIAEDAIRALEWPNYLEELLNKYPEATNAFIN